MTNTRTYRTLISSRANEAFGAVKYTLTETVTARDGGVQVDTHARGMSEGEHVDQRSSNFYPGVSLESAGAYRLRNGYQDVSEVLA